MRGKRITGLVLAMILLSGCGVKNDISPTNVSQNQVIAGGCKTEPVTIEGYGDKGKRLANCFVEYPGEPSRQDKSYYVVEDICGQFTKEFIQNALVRPIASIEPSPISSVYGCSYYLDENKKSYVMLVMDYLKMANQKTGVEAMGRRTEESGKIPMRNMVVWQEDGRINDIYLVLGDEKFIRIERSSAGLLTDEEMMIFASNIAKEIKNYK